MACQSHPTPANIHARRDAHVIIAHLCGYWCPVEKWLLLVAGHPGHLHCHYATLRVEGLQESVPRAKVSGRRLSGTAITKMN